MFDFLKRKSAEPNRVVTCRVCSYGVLPVKGGNFVKTLDGSYEHSDIQVCCWVNKDVKKRVKRELEKKLKNVRNDIKRLSKESNENKRRTIKTT